MHKDQLKFNTVTYETRGGSKPVEDYLRRLTRDDPTQVGRVLRAIRLLRTWGLELGGLHVKPLGGGLFELRTSGGHAHRVFYFAIDGPKFVLLHAFYKTTRKTPPEEIKGARSEMADYIERMGRA